jgi:hypothetical protein
MMEPDLELPERLKADLRALHAPRGSVPAEVEDAILAAAPVMAPAPVRRPFLVRATPLAAAAALVLVVGLWWRLQGTTPQAPEIPPNAVARVEDIDGSGRVDILDALVLARGIEENQGALSARFDFDGNGKIDRDDASHVAQLAVRIDT